MKFVSKPRRGREKLTELMLNISVGNWWRVESGGGERLNIAALDEARGGFEQISNICI